MNTTEKHRGYVGSVEVDFSDNILHGRVLFINDLITYEAESAGELAAAFKAAVDEYLEDCATLNKQPNKPFSGSFNVRISPESHRAAAIQAAKAGITLNEFVGQAISLRVQSNDANRAAPLLDQAFLTNTAERLKLIVNTTAPSVRQTFAGDAARFQTIFYAEDLAGYSVTNDTTEDYWPQDVDRDLALLVQREAN